MKMMKTIAKLLALLFIVCIVAFSVTLFIGGRDIAPPDVSDIMPDKPQEIPNDQNAFPLLNEAANTVQLPQDLTVMIKYTDGIQLFDMLIPGILAKNEKVFAILDKAAQRNRCLVPADETGNFCGAMEGIGLLLEVRAVHARNAGDFGLSARSMAVQILLGALIQADAGDLYQNTVGSRLMVNGLKKARILASTPGIEADVLHLLAQTLAEMKPVGPGLERSIQNKFKSVADQLDGFRASGKNIEQTFAEAAVFPYLIRKTTWIPGYMFRENETKERLAGLYRNAEQNALKDYGDMTRLDTGQYLGLQGSQFAFIYGPNVVGRLFYVFTTPELGIFLESKCQLEGEIRATGLIIALKLFERDNGRLPDNLSALVPEYLNEVPADPYDGQPFRYDAKKEIIYSVSKDLKDSGGSQKIPEGEIYGEDYPKTWVAEDAVFPVGGGDQ